MDRGPGAGGGGARRRFGFAGGAARAERWVSARPALTAGLSLALGGALGLSGGMGLGGGMGVSPGSGAPLGSAAWACAAAAALGFAAVGSARGAVTAARRAGRRRSGVVLGPAAWLALAALAASAARSSAAVEVFRGPPAPVARGADAAAPPRLDRAVAGRLVRKNHGWALASDPPHPWRLAFDGPAPAPGSDVVLLPPGELRPFARGPALGPAARRGEVLGVHTVAIDELVRVDEPRAHGTLAALASPVAAARAGLVERCAALGLTGERGLAPALLVGDRGALDRDAADIFTRTGTRHLLALSGLHVGLLAAVVLWPLGAVAARVAGAVGAAPARRRFVADAARVLWLLLFALLAGAAPPVVRATLALGAVLLARHVPTGYGPPLGPGPEGPANGGVGVGRRPDALSIWGAALALECVVDPLATRSLSVTLSYAATLGILVAAGAVRHALLRRRGKERRALQVLRWHRPLPLIAVSIAAERSAGWLATAVACSVAAVAATFPLMASTFGELAPVGIVATVAAVPLVALLLPTLWLAVATGLPAVVSAATALEVALVALLEFFDRWPGTPWLVPTRPEGLAWLAVGLVGVGILATTAPSNAPWRDGHDGHDGRDGDDARRRSRTRLARRALLAAAACGAVLVLPLRPQPAGLEIVALDVGHGTAVALRAPGSRALLFDAGSRDRPRLVSEALAPLARAWELQSADLCVSHSDLDHRSAVDWIVTRLEPKRRFGWTAGEWDSGAAAGPGHLDLVGSPPSRADLWLDGDLRVSLVRGAPGDGNEGSRSLLVRWRGRRVLLCGDAVDEGLLASLDAGHLDGPVDLLLLPHHGSYGVGVTALLERVRPDAIWISTSTRPRIAAELDRRGENWTSTGRDGPLRTVLGAVPDLDRNPPRPRD